MGLSLAVGCSSFEKEDFDTLSQALKDANLKEHNEPVLEDVSCFSADMFGYSGLHYVRRLAAYLAQGDLVPGSGTDQASDDPAVKKYYSRVHPAQPGFFDQAFILLCVEMALQLRHSVHRHTHNDQQ